MILFNTKEMRLKENQVFNDPAGQEPGHVFMVGLPGLELDDSTRQLISQDKIHNFILF